MCEQKDKNRTYYLGFLWIGSLFGQLKKMKEQEQLFSHAVSENSKGYPDSCCVTLSPTLSRCRWTFAV